MRHQPHRIADLSAGAPNLGAAVKTQLASLADVCGIAETPRLCVQRIFEIFTRESLDRPAVVPFRGLSFINADGLPFQWVFNFCAGASGLCCAKYMLQNGLGDVTIFEIGTQIDL